jgi:hypothetical protein
MTKCEIERKEFKEIEERARYEYLTTVFHALRAMNCTAGINNDGVEFALLQLEKAGLAIDVKSFGVGSTSNLAKLLYESLEEEKANEIVDKLIRSL